MLVGSQKKTVEIYQREKDAWILRTYKPGDTIYLSSVDVEITFDDIYAKTNVRDSR